MIQVKDHGLELNVTTANIKLYQVNNVDDIKALYALCGGYNEVARNVDIEYFEKQKEKFQAIVSDLAYSMKNS